MHAERTGQGAAIKEVVPARTLRLARMDSVAAAFCSTNTLRAALAAIFWSQLVPTIADL